MGEELGMLINLKSANIIQSFKILKGNARTTIMFEPMWGIPFVLFNFYLSLYMKSQGITDREIGYLISIGCISGVAFAMLGGLITDRMGRKRTTLIFDLLSWPAAVVIYFFSNSFWMFALATIINSMTRIVTVSLSLMIIEDSDNEERVAAFNLQNIINISTGIITPVGGILVNLLGVANAERVFLAFAGVSMTSMMFIRNHYYTETSVGKQAMERHRGVTLKDALRKGLYSKTIGIIKEKPVIGAVMYVVILFNIYILIGTYSSLYFAPYMTEVLGIGKSTVSILGGVISATMLVVFVFVNPIISRYNRVINMITGLIIQACSLFMLVLIPQNLFLMAIVSVMLYAVGFSVFKPFIDSMLAEVTEGSERAGIYSLINTMTSILSTMVGFISGYLYVLNPRLIYIVSIIMLLFCAAILTGVKNLNGINKKQLSI